MGENTPSSAAPPVLPLPSTPLSEGLGVQLRGCRGAGWWSRCHLAPAGPVSPVPSMPPGLRAGLALHGRGQAHGFHVPRCSLLHQIPLIPPESSRWQTVTWEESCSCEAPLGARGAPRAPSAPHSGCDELGGSQADPGIDSCCGGHACARGVPVRGFSSPSGTPGEEAPEEHPRPPPLSS